MQKVRPLNNRQKVSATTVLREQKNVCRFIYLKIYSYATYNHRSVRNGFKIRLGLQIENKFFYMEGENVKTVSMNGQKETYITDIYPGVPKNAHEKLLEKRTKFLKSIGKSTDYPTDEDL